MFWLDMVLTMTLPLVAMGMFALLMMVVIKHTAFKHEVDYAPVRVQGTAQMRRQEPRIRTVSVWESPLDAEVQRLRRKHLEL